MSNLIIKWRNYRVTVVAALKISVLVPRVKVMVIQGAVFEIVLVVTLVVSLVLFIVKSPKLRF